MEAVNFYPTVFHEIPDQDNPAFGGDECLMIVGEANTNSGHAVVLHIVPDPIESVTSIAKFWHIKYAVQFCNEFIPLTKQFNAPGKQSASNINEIEYIPDIKAIDVTFIGGKKFRYLNVQIDIWRGLYMASSVGSYLNRFMKNEYSYISIVVINQLGGIYGSK